MTLIEDGHNELEPILKLLSKIRKHWRKFKAISLVISGTSVITGAIGFGSSFGLDTLYKSSLIMQTAVILVLIFLLDGPPEPSDKDRDVFATARQFSFIWAGFWISLFLFYLMRSGMAFWGNDPPSFIRFMVDGIGAVSGGFLLICYLTMVQSKTRDGFWWLRISVGIALGSLIPIALNVLCDVINLTSADKFFKTIEGMFGGVTLALLIGRLESKFIGSPIWLISILYCYAVLQGTYSIIADNPKTNPEIMAFILIINVAFILKIILYWHIRRIIVSGRLTEYIRSYRLLPEPAPSEVI